MLRLFSSKAQGRKDFRKPSKPCHVGIHWIALAEYSQMSTHVPGFQSFFRFFASFCIGQISHHQHKGGAIMGYCWLESEGLTCTAGRDLPVAGWPGPLPLPMPLLQLTLNLLSVLQPLFITDQPENRKRNVWNFRWRKEWICRKRPITICAMVKGWTRQGSLIWHQHEVTWDQEPITDQPENRTGMCETYA